MQLVQIPFQAYMFSNQLNNACTSCYFAGVKMNGWLKGEVHPTMITSYLVVFGELSRMVKVRGGRDKPFWIYKRLNNCAAPAPDSDDVLVVEEEAFLCVGHAKEATTKTSSLSGAGRRNYSIAYISKTAYRMHLGPSPFVSAPQTLQDMKLSFWVNFPFKSQVLVASRISLTIIDMWLWMRSFISTRNSRFH